MSNLLKAKDYRDAAKEIDVEIAVIKAVAKVESNGDGFLSDGRPIILFEGHKFHKHTGGIYDESEPTISYARWTKKYYLGGATEYIRFHIASALDHVAALKSTSWGKFQILGENYKLCGYTNISTFIHEMQISERHHLMAFIEFVKSCDLVKHLKAHSWAKFARGYNGPGYKKNKYDTKLAAAYRKYSK